MPLHPLAARRALWDAVFTGKMAEWIMNVETEGNEEEEWMPDDMRIAGLDIGFDMYKREAHLKCSKAVRVVGKESLELVERKTVIMWWL
jgi:hypothetical protein